MAADFPVISFANMSFLKMSNELLDMIIRPLITAMMFLSVLFSTVWLLMSTWMLFDTPSDSWMLLMAVMLFRTMVMVLILGVSKLVFHTLIFPHARVSSVNQAGVIHAWKFHRSLSAKRKRARGGTLNIHLKASSMYESMWKFGISARCHERSVLMRLSINMMSNVRATRQLFVRGAAEWTTLASSIV
jgi:hypothetical protein